MVQPCDPGDVWLSKFDVANQPSYKLIGRIINDPTYDIVQNRLPPRQIQFGFKVGFFWLLITAETRIIALICARSQACFSVIRPKNESFVNKLAADRAYRRHSCVV
jgi:hypothetical protein